MLTGFAKTLHQLLDDEQDAPGTGRVQIILAQRPEPIEVGLAEMPKAFFDALGEAKATPGAYDIAICIRPEPNFQILIPLVEAPALIEGISKAMSTAFQKALETYDNGTASQPAPTTGP